MPAPLPPSGPPAIGRRTRITYPGALSKAVAERMEELKSGTFSRFAIELVCYDLRIRRRHSITRPIADYTPAVQEAVDLEIGRHFRPKQERGGDLMRQIVRDGVASVTTEPTRPVRARAFSTTREWVFFPALLHEIIGIRWQELQFASVSDYVTSVMRYDLLLGGPHKYFRGDDCSPQMLAALDRETLQEFHAQKRPRTLADHIVEEAAGKKLTIEQCDAALSDLGQGLRQQALRKGA